MLTIVRGPSRVSVRRLLDQISYPLSVNTLTDAIAHIERNPTAHTVFLCNEPELWQIYPAIWRYQQLAINSHSNIKVRTVLTAPDLLSKEFNIPFGTAQELLSLWMSEPIPKVWLVDATLETDGHISYVDATNRFFRDRANLSLLDKVEAILVKDSNDFEKAVTEAIKLLNNR